MRKHQPTTAEQVAGLPMFDATEDDYVAPPARLGRTFDVESDAQRLATHTARVLDLMLDGGQHTVEELRTVGGAQGERRLRELRDTRYGYLSVEAWRIGGGEWRYRLTGITDAQLLACARTLKLHPDRLRDRVRGVLRIGG